VRAIIILIIRLALKLGAVGVEARGEPAARKECHK
jgi:hypothetical protein